MVRLTARDVLCEPACGCTTGWPDMLGLCTLAGAKPKHFHTTWMKTVNPKKGSQQLIHLFASCL